MNPLYCGSEFVKQLCDALEVPHDKFRRIILDIGYDNVALVYVEMLADEERLKLVPLEGLKIIHDS